MKKWMIGVCHIAVLVLFCAASGAFAWQVTVTNNGPHHASVAFWGNHLFASTIEAYREINVGESLTFDTGGICPSGLSGYLHQKGGTSLGPPIPDKTIASLAPTSILTGNYSDPTFFTACCWNSSWTICRKSDNPGVIANNDYGFCKQ